MNIHDYLEKAVTIEQIKPDIPLTQGGNLVVRFAHYPEPQYGVVLFAGLPNVVEWARDILRSNVEKLLDNVVNDCIQIVAQTDTIDDAAKETITNAVHAHFGTWPR